VRFIDEQRAVFGVEPICRVIDFPPSIYYERRSRPPSPRAVADAALCARIEAIWRDSGETYGAPRVHAQLARDGVYVARKRVERLMRRNGWRGACLRSGWKTTTIRTAAATGSVPDLVQRDFAAARPDALWLADITYVRTWQGFFYLAMVLDVFSRRIVGWMMDDHLRTELVLGALEMAIWRRDTSAGLVHHSDHGAQYTSFAFSQRLVDAGITASLGSVGDSLDTAMAESWFGTIKVELVYRHMWRSRHDAEGGLSVGRGLVQPPAHPAGAGLAKPRRVRAGLPRRPRPHRPRHRQACAGPRRCQGTEQP
jgi:transposase InsO family protein